jgi:translation initiation factor 2 subunit 2
MSDEIYLNLLERARSKLPSKIEKAERFELPKPISSIAGNRTILSNIKEICDRLRRDQSHFLKFLSGELATAGTLEGNQATFQGRFNYRTFERLIRRYTQNYITCPVCQRPDTRIVKENRYNFLICDACGARSSIR